MDVGIRLNLNWVFSFHASTLTNSSSCWPSSYSFGGVEASYESSRVCFPYVTYGERDTLYSDPLRVRTCSSAPQILENDYSEAEEIKMNVSKMLCGGLYGTIDYNLPIPEEDKVSFLTSLQARKASQFNLLMKNLDRLEEIFVDSDVITLENNILMQLERLGALQLFQTFLSRSLELPTSVDASDLATGVIEEPRMNDRVDDRMAKIVVRSGKKEERKTRRERRLEKAKNVSEVALPLRTNHKRPKQHHFSLARRSSKSRGGRLKLIMNETEMSKGVKLVSDLERIRMVLEKEAGEVSSLSRWAKAAGVEKKVLQEKLHFGSYCRDELLRSTRSLVLYIARYYRGLGVDFEDLLQAGYFGVLQGAERFDHTRGYKFSTYVQYWIRKSMSMFVAHHSRGIRVPLTLSKAINKIKKARKALCRSHGKFPADLEIAKFTGLSMAKITSANKCARVVGSVDDRIGDFTTAKLLEVIPDTTTMTPEESVMRQQMMKDLNDLLNGLNPIEKQVLVLRFGLGDHQTKSLGEIGKLFSVSKEWIRKIERKALTKLRDEKTLKNLSHYKYM
ncbi:hypothetical protein LguiB_011991 [Lonicera macranthoides]